MSYTELPVGKYQLAVAKKGDTAPLKIFNVDVKPDSFFTILLSPHSGVMAAELIDDTPDPKEQSGTLVMRNYFSGLSASVSSNGQKMIDGLQYGESRAATGIPLTRQQLKLAFNLGKAAPAESTAEADFHSSKHVTLLIIPDSYGRFCTRVALDGKNL